MGCPIKKQLKEDYFMLYGILCQTGNYSYALVTTDDREMAELQKIRLMEGKTLRDVDLQFYSIKEFVSRNTLICAGCFSLSFLEFKFAY